MLDRLRTDSGLSHVILLFIVLKHETCAPSEEGTNYQEMLLELTGQKTVPNVFINKKHVGGCDKTMQVRIKVSLLPAVVAVFVAGVLFWRGCFRLTETAACSCSWVDRRRKTKKTKRTTMT